MRLIQRQQRGGDACTGGRALAGAATLATVALGLLAPVAAAGFEPGAVPASTVGAELGDQHSSGPMLSGDGRYVVFRTNSPTLLGLPSEAAEFYSTGFVRKDLLTGALDLVATPERRLRSDRSLVAAGVAQGVAGVSDDGRYVLLSSTAPLVDEVQSSVTPEVYVRDMRRPRSDPSGYELVSAQDGTTRPPRYDDRTAGSGPGLAGYSLSDDGRVAVFVTETASSLPSGSATTAPRWQVFVRDLDARTTRLVTRDRSDATLPGSPVPDVRGAVRPVAAVSGDGSAVAWIGSNAEQQARFLVGEEPATSQLLWRDLNAGPGAPVRRVAGAADPDDPACPPGATYVPSLTATGPCYGPFAEPEERTPSGPTPPELLGISDDGRRVLFKASGKLRPFTGVHRDGRGFVADMRPGVSRKQGVAVVWSQPATRMPILTGALAGDGVHAAFVSYDSQFDELQPVGAFQSGELTTPNVFAVDLHARTVERATAAPNGSDYRLGQITGGASLGDPSVSDDGAAIAFSADDGNLFVGDVNEARDVQVVRREAARSGPERDRELPPPPPPPVVTEPPLQPLTTLHLAIGAVLVDRNGVARVRVRVPAAGALSARATGRVPRAAGTRPRAGVPVGSDGRRLRRPTTVTLRIAPSRGVRKLLLGARRGMLVRLRIRFDARGRAPSAADRHYTLSGQVRRARAPKRRGRRRPVRRAASNGGRTGRRQ